MSSEEAPGRGNPAGPIPEDLLTPDEQVLTEQTREAMRSGEMDVVSIDEAERRLHRSLNAPRPDTHAVDFQKWEDELH